MDFKSEWSKMYAEAHLRFEIGCNDGILRRCQTLSDAITVATESYLDADGLYIEDRAPRLAGFPTILVVGPDGRLQIGSRQ